MKTPNDHAETTKRRTLKKDLRSSSITVVYSAVEVYISTDTDLFFATFAEVEDTTVEMDSPSQENHVSGSACISRTRLSAIGF